MYKNRVKHRVSGKVRRAVIAVAASSKQRPEGIEGDIEGGDVVAIYAHGAWRTGIATDQGAIYLVHEADLRLERQRYAHRLRPGVAAALDERWGYHSIHESDRGDKPFEERVPLRQYPLEPYHRILIEKRG